MNEKSTESASTSKDAATAAAGKDDDRIPLLGYEQNLMLDTFTEDVLFVMARGLGMERLFLNHLHLYSDRRFTVLVLNTAPEDEQYFLEKLKALNPDCPPKVLTAEVLSKDRELIYNTGGVQFVTSRILMVDLLTGRVPTDRVAGILVYRAHQLLHTYQESFILRLYREKKQGGFVKAFTDHPGGIAGAGIGQLQRLIDRLYVRRVRVVPRFDADVKDSYDADPPKFIEYSIELAQNERRLRAYLVDIIGTCVRELKQSTHGTDMEVEETDASDSTSAAGLNPSTLELQLRKKTLMLSERQERLLNDLQLLRGLLQRVEDLDPVTAYQYAAKIRGDKDIIDKNSGWIFTSTAAKVFSGLDSLCSAKDTKGNPTIVAPAKWSGLKSVLAELTLSVEQEDSEAPVLVLASNERTCRQLIDLVKFGDAKMCWMLTKSLLEGKPDNPGPEPETLPLWNPDLVVYYDSQVTTDGHKNLVSELKQGQKKASRPVKKRGMKKTALAVEADPKQPKLVNFGIVRYKEKRAEKRGAKIDAFEA